MSPVRRLASLALVTLLAAAGCGGGGGEEGASASSASGAPIRIGYSAWPGWFPWAVAEEEGIFEEVGVDVELVFFPDYLTSLEAMSAGRLDLNGQTLNDTLVGVSAGSDQRAVIVNDNSAGNDVIVADESITGIEDLEGATVAAELGVVDHFLLLQGLETVGLTEDDLDLRGMPTDAAAAAFASGQFDAVGVFAPFSLRALERPGSHVLFDSSEFPGTIPDLMVASGDAVEDRPDEIQDVVEVWYRTLEWIEANPDEAIATMAEAAELSTADYESLMDGTRIFDAEEAMEAFESDELPTGLRPMAEKIDAFLVDTGLAEEEAPLEDLLDPSFTRTYLEGTDG